MGRTASVGGEVLESRGIDHIPEEERRGHAWHLLTFWGASNVQILAISVGVLAVVLGLNLTWAIVTIVVGNALGGIYMALHSAQGPRLGLPQMMQSRAQFGMYGAALPNAVVVIMYIGYFVSSAILGGQAIAALFHITTAEGIILANLFVLALVIFGYQLFHQYNRYVSVVSLAVFLAILAKLVTMLPAHLPAGHNSAGVILLAISIFVSWQVTWAPYVSDYSRYLPKETSARATFLYTYLGSVLGGSLVMSIGAIAAVVSLHGVTVNAPAYLGGLFGVSWLFLIIFILGVGSGNLGNLYGPFLTFHAIVSPSGSLANKDTGKVSRVVTTTVIAAIGTVIAILASANFITELTNFLSFILYLLIPWTAINLTDFYLVRHGHYDIAEMYKVDGTYGKANWLALAIYAVTVGVEIPFMNSAIYEGPVARALGGADITWIVGFVFAVVVYYVGSRLSGSHARAGSRAEASPALGASS